MRFSVNRSGVGKQLREKFSADVPQTPDDIFGKIRYMHDVALKIADPARHEAVSVFPGAESGSRVDTADTISGLRWQRFEAWLNE